MNDFRMRTNADFQSYVYSELQEIKRELKELQVWKTKSDLKAEIMTHINRLRKAETTLRNLPIGFVDRDIFKRRQAKKSALNAEITAVRQIILYAKEAYDEM